MLFHYFISPPIIHINIFILKCIYMKGFQEKIVSIMFLFFIFSSVGRTTVLKSPWLWVLGKAPVRSWERVTAETHLGHLPLRCRVPPFPRVGSHDMSTVLLKKKNRIKSNCLLYMVLSRCFRLEKTIIHYSNRPKHNQFLRVVPGEP